MREKILMRQIKLHVLRWDRTLPTDLLTKRHDFLQGYPILKNIRTPRWVQFRPTEKLQYSTDGVFTQLHIQKVN